MRLFDLMNPIISFNISYLVFISGAPIVFLMLGVDLGYQKDTYLYIYSYPFFCTIAFVFFQLILSNKKLKLNKTDKLLNKNFKYLINFSFGVLGFYYLFYQAGSIPLLSENAETLRVEFSRGKGTKILLFTALIYYGSINYVINKGLNFKSIIIIVLGSSTILFLGFRSPAFYYLISCFLGYNSNNKKYLSKGAFNYKILIILGLLFPVASLIGLYRSGFTLSSSLELFINMKHLFLVNSNNFNLIVEGYRQIDFQYGASFINDFLVGIPGSDNEFSGVKLKKYLGVDFIGQTMTVTLPGEGYINLGGLGVILHSIFLGFIISFLNELFRIKNNTSNRFYLVILNIVSFRIVTGGIMPILIFVAVPIMIITVINSLNFKLNNYSISRLNHNNLKNE